MIPNLWKAYGAIWSLYLILAVADGVRGAAWKGGPIRTPIVPLVCAAVHGVYGLSTLVGLFMLPFNSGSRVCILPPRAFHRLVDHFHDRERVEGDLGRGTEPAPRR